MIFLHGLERLDYMPFRNGMEEYEHMQRWKDKKKNDKEKRHDKKTLFSIS